MDQISIVCAGVNVVLLAFGYFYIEIQNICFKVNV